MRFCQRRTVRVCIIWFTQRIDQLLWQQENFFLRSKSPFSFEYISQFVDQTKSPNKILKLFCSAAHQ